MKDGDYIQVIFTDGRLDLQARVTSLDGCDRLIAIMEVCKAYFIKEGSKPENMPEKKP